MSLPLAYSSDEEDIDISKDAFGLESLPASKKPRTDEQAMVVADAAPHVLAEVCIFYCAMDSHSAFLGPSQPDLVSHTPYRHPNEC